MVPISIAPARHADADDLIQANLDSRDYHAPWVCPFRDMAGFESWFGQLLTGPNFSFVARHDNSGAIIGVVNLSQIVWGGFRSAYLGYYGMKEFAGQGFMTHAVELSATYAFQELGLHRLEANIQPANAASISLVRSIGFIKEGFSPRYLKIDNAWRDHERWALLADGWLMSAAP